MFRIPSLMILLSNFVSKNQNSRAFLLSIIKTNYFLEIGNKMVIFYESLNYGRPRR